MTLTVCTVLCLSIVRTDNRNRCNVQGNCEIRPSYNMSFLSLVYVGDQTQSQLIAMFNVYLPQSPPPFVWRLQFMNIPGGKSLDSQFLTSFEHGNPEIPFVAACPAYHRGLDAEMWLFSYLEVGKHTPEQTALAEFQVPDLPFKAGEIEETFLQLRKSLSILLVGSINETMFDIL